MTTAARPTWDTAKGGTSTRERDLSSLSKQYSSRDLPSHTSLKTREPGQGTTDEFKNKDFKRDLEEREKIAYRQSANDKARKAGKALDSPPPVKRSRNEAISMANLDADDPVDVSDSDSGDDSDDDTAMLMAELNKIKAEKAADDEEKEMVRRDEEERIRMENILTGNPLLKEKYADTAAKSDMKIKRRWDDDVVFKNCSRAEPEHKEGTFINDSLRNEFHKKFMDKYIK
jgi:protein CWC15